MNSVNLNCLFKDLIPKYSHFLRYRVLGLQHINLVERDMIQPMATSLTVSAGQGFRRQFCSQRAVLLRVSPAVAVRWWLRWSRRGWSA